VLQVSPTALGTLLLIAATAPIACLLGCVTEWDRSPALLEAPCHPNPQVCCFSGSSVSCFDEASLVVPELQLCLDQLVDLVSLLWPAACNRAAYLSVAAN
jgi:hypothetical protein